MTRYLGVVVETAIYGVDVKVADVIELEKEMQKAHANGLSIKRYTTTVFHPVSVSVDPPSIAEVAATAAENRTATEPPDPDEPQNR